MFNKGHKYDESETNTLTVRMSDNLSHFSARKRKRFHAFWYFVVILFFLSGIPVGIAQSGNGSITGTISDSMGAVISGATVVAKNLATGRPVLRQSTSMGLYSVQPLEVGDYSLTMSAKGFGTTTIAKVHVDALQTVTINVTLNPGTLTETVNVTTGGLNETTPDIGDSVNSQDYQLLPLMMSAAPRDPTSFLKLANGVDTNLGYNGGAATYENETYLDGIVATTINMQGAANNTSGGAIVEAVEQSEVETVGISAKYQGQGFNNFTLKSGTNKWHGSTFEFFRNTSLDTWNYLSKQTKDAAGDIVKPSEKQNEYGFVLGGPIQKDKAFFFIGLERMDYRTTPNPSYYSLPTTAMREGDFSSYSTLTGYNIYDPATTICSGSSCSRTQFTDNIIPSSQLSAVSKNIQSFLPTNLVNQNVENNYLGSQPYGYDYFKSSAKGDYQLNANHRLSASYLVGQRAPTNMDSGSVLPMPYSATTRTVTFDNTGILGLNSVLTPYLVNDLKLNLLRYETVGSDPAYGGKYSASAMGLSPLPSGWATEGFPVVVFSGNYAPHSYDANGTTNNTNRPQTVDANTIGISNNLEWTKGSHDLSIGAQMMWYQYNSQLPLGGSSQAWTFNTSTTSQFSSGTTPSTTDGATYAGFLLGDLTALYLSSNVNFTSIGGRFKAFSPYIQDDWKITKDLTLNLGLRWDVFSPYREVNNRMTWFNPDLDNPITGTKGTIQYAGHRNAYSCNCSTRYSTYLGNLGPRIGFAYKLNHNLVMHGSYSIMTTHSGGEGGRGGAREGTNQFGLSSSDSLTQSSGYEVVQQWDATLPTLSTPSYDNTYGIGYTTTTGYTGTPQTIYYDDPSLARRPAYYQNYSLGFQDQILPHTLVSVDYSGSVGHFLPNANGHGIYSNQVQPQYLVLGSLLTSYATTANIASANTILTAAGLSSISLPYSNFSSSATIGTMLRPWPMYTLGNNFQQDGNSAYNSLMFSLKEQNWKGLSLTVNYTYSRLIDDLIARPTTYIKTNKWDVANGPQALKIYGSWVTPKYGSSRWQQRLSKDWILSSIFTYASSTPLTFSTSCSSIFNYFGTCRPSLSSSYTGGSFRSKVPYGSANFTKSAFKSNPFTTSKTSFGNMPHSNPYGVTGPTTYTWDGSLRRAFPIWRGHFIFGADMFNITNHVEATGLTTTITSSSFGLATKQSNSSRDVQINAKYEF
jgi:hypothetical protein